MSEHVCVDCKLDPPKTVRPAPYCTPGGTKCRCATHERAEKLRVKRRNRAAREERVYNVSEEDSEGLWEFQGRRCAICQRPVKVRAAANDHDHRCCPGPTSCGKCVRGKLCKPCNSMLAHARDSVQFFIRAARYLLDPPAPRYFKQRNRL